MIIPPPPPPSTYSRNISIFCFSLHAENDVTIIVKHLYRPIRYDWTGEGNLYPPSQRSSILQFDRKNFSRIILKYCRDPEIFSDQPNFLCFWAGHSLGDPMYYRVHVTGVPRGFENFTSKQYNWN